MARYEMRDTRYETGSALILTVVLTSLLAIIGVMFIMVARVNKMATSAISENKDLDSAIEAVVALVSQELILDVPGMPEKEEYYDYPDEKNEWLASLEPYEKTAGNYYWRHISDVTGYIEKVILGAKGSWDTQDIEISNSAPDLFKAIVEDHKKIELDNNGNLREQLADADGDGVADSKWIELDDITSNKGKPIYAAIRIVDNSGMINVNTAYKFKPNQGRERIDGSSQMQINLAALSQRGSNGSLDNAAADLQYVRCGNGSEPYGEGDIPKYERDVVWRYNEPDGDYTPFDISDELELRNRFMLNRNDVDTRAEEVWDSVFQDHYLSVPVDSPSSFSNWRAEIYYDWSEPNAPNDYSYRHIATTRNMDRIIDPNGDKMININEDNIGPIYGALRKVFSTEPNFVGDVNDVAAQITVNLIDYRDTDSDVTDYNNPDDGKIYYGFERPCAYISELSHVFREDPNIPGKIYRSYAIELYKPYFEDNDPCGWQLVIEGTSYGIDWSQGSRRFYVIRWEDPNVPAYLIPVLVPVGDFNDPNDPNDPNVYDPNDYEYRVITVPLADSNTIFEGGDLIRLQRRVDDINDIWITVDSKIVPEANNGWLEDVDGTAHSIQRDITLHKCIRRLWSSAGKDSSGDSPTLSQHNNYIDLDSRMIQAHPANKDFTNVGEIGMLFRKDAYSDIVRGAVESEVRLNLADPNFQQLFKYLTVTAFDPTNDNINNDGDDWIDEDALNQTPEWKVPGRININTAPWFVLAQLPWMTPDIAQGVVSYRDDHDGFESIGELMNVDEMGYYANNEIGDLDGFPDLTPGGSQGDGAADDFEEWDVIFARISNLITVRSDVFTAYILVRIGPDGPQKRVITILDRSNVYPPNRGKVRIITLHPIPDPR